MVSRQLRDEGCDVIVDDITYITEPFFKDGVIAQAVDEVTSTGVNYFTSAGNFGDKSYEGVFSPVAAPAGYVGVAHNFGGDLFPGSKSNKRHLYDSVTMG